MDISQLDLKLIAWFRRSFQPIARLATFIIFFWSGALNFFDLSPARPLASALAAQTRPLGRHRNQGVFLAREKLN